MKSYLKKGGLLIALTLAAGTAGLASCGGQAASTMAQAEAAFEKNQFRVARIHLANVMAEGASDTKTNLLYAKLMLELGDGISAEATIGKLSKDAISDAERKILLAHSYIMQGKADKTIALYDGAGRDALSEQDFRMLAWAYREQGATDQYAQTLSDGLARFPGSGYINTFAGTERLDAGDIPAAATFAEKALRSGPRDYEALILNGRVKIFQGDLKTARGFYAKASEYYPDHAVPLANMAGLDLDMGDTKSAEKVLKRALPQHPSFPFLRFQKARLDYQNGDYKSARAAMHGLQDTYETYVPAMLLNGKIASKTGQKGVARRFLSRVLAEEPGNQEAQTLLDSLG